MDHNDGIVTEGRDVLDQSVAGSPGSEVVAITEVSVDSDVTLAGVSIDEDNSNADLRGQRLNLRVGVVVENRADSATIVCDYALDGFERSDE